LDQSSKPSRPTTRPGVDARSIALGMLVLYLVWGSTYLAIAVAVDTIPPFLMAGARFLLAGVVLFAWVAVRNGRSALTASRREWRDSLVVGALLLGGGMGMVAFGEQTVPSGITALLIGLMPVWVAIFGRAFLGERLPGIALVGIVVGFIGVGILVGPTLTGGSGALDPLGLLAIIISPISWSLGSLYASHRAMLPRQPLLATGLQMLLGGVVLLGMSLIAGEPADFDPLAVSSASVTAFLYLAVIGSLLAFTAYGWLLRVAPLPLVATYAYVNPVVAVILGAIVLQEPIDARTVLAGAVIVGAVALIVTARNRMSAPRPVARPVSPPPGPSARPAAPAPSRSASD
jgi:drug/metabolite transporter (DMT)-like permease